MPKIIRRKVVTMSAEYSPRRDGSSPRRWMGITGKSWSTAQWSGADWKMEKLPK